MAHDPMASIATADLVSELLARYQEGLFIGYNQIPTNDGRRRRRPRPAVDVTSKLNKETALAGILTNVLTDLLGRLKTGAGPAGPRTRESSRELSGG